MLFKIKHDLNYSASSYHFSLSLSIFFWRCSAFLVPPRSPSRCLHDEHHFRFVCSGCPGLNGKRSTGSVIALSWWTDLLCFEHLWYFHFSSTVSICSSNNDFWEHHRCGDNSDQRRHETATRHSYQCHYLFLYPLQIYLRIALLHGSIIPSYFLV